VDAPGLSMAWGELDLACGSLLVGMRSGQQPGNGDAAWVSMRFPRVQCPICSPGKEGRMHFRCWKVSPASATSQPHSGGDSSALTAVGLQASSQEALS